MKSRSERRGGELYIITCTNYFYFHVYTVLDHPNLHNIHKYLLVNIIISYVIGKSELVRFPTARQAMTFTECGHIPQHYCGGSISASIRCWASSALFWKRRRRELLPITGITVNYIAHIPHHRILCPVLFTRRVGDCPLASDNTDFYYMH